jgi:hypothetical protein
MVCPLTGQSFVILVGGRRKALIKCHRIFEKNQLGKNVLRHEALGLKRNYSALGGFSTRQLFALSLLAR